METTLDWACVQDGETRNAYRILVGKSFWKTTAMKTEKEM
jgi:hypothetical protein